ncbi:hypothetical protein [Roseibium sp.]|uniref:hypothetical protein n=1 Tax=Roseibium sp. TaxID=1936156 RepID=UPI003B51C0A4
MSLLDRFSDLLLHSPIGWANLLFLGIAAVLMVICVLKERRAQQGKREDRP